MHEVLANCLGGLSMPRRQLTTTPLESAEGETFISPSTDSRMALVISYWHKYVHKVLVNHLGGLSLPRKSVVR